MNKEVTLKQVFNYLVCNEYITLTQFGKIKNITEEDVRKELEELIKKYER